MERSLTELRRVEQYPRFYLTATVTRLADEMFAVGAVLLILARTGSAPLAGFVLAAATLPSLVTGPLLGAWLDITGRRRRLMVLDQVVVTLMLLGLLLATGSAPDWTLPLITLTAGLTWPLSFGGFTSLIPFLVPERLLDEANAMEAASFDVAIIAGPALAGTLVAVSGPGTSLLVEAGLSLLGLVLIVSLAALDRPPRASGRGLVETAKAGLRALAASPPLRSATAIGCISLAGLGILTVAFPFFATHELGEPRSVSGYLWAAFSAGSIIGSLSLVPLARKLRPERLMLVAVGLSGCSMLLWPLASVLPLAMALIALSGLCDGPGLAATFAVRQQHAPRDLYGQVSTTAVSLKVGCFSLGSAMAGGLVVWLGARGALWACAALQVLAVLAGWLLSRDRAPDPGREGERKGASSAPLPAGRA